MQDGEYRLRDIPKQDGSHHTSRVIDLPVGRIAQRAPRRRDRGGEGKPRPPASLAGGSARLYLVPMPPARSSVGAILRQLRTHPRPDHPKGLTVAEAARRTGLWGEAVSDSFWAQVESGRSNASESTLLKMALAVDARPEEIETLFHTAGYGYLYDTLVNIGASSRQGSLHGAEAGILTDPRLPNDKRRSLLDHLTDILDGLEGRERLVASEAPEYPEEADDNGG